MKNAKFRVRDAEHSKEIQEVLFGLGFEWRGVGKNISCLDKAFIYAETDQGMKHMSHSGQLGKLDQDDIQFFEEQSIPECDIVNGTICELAKVKPVMNEVEGLRPWHEVAKARLEEILEAMLRSAKAGKSIPDEWDNEYDSIREELNAHYEPAERLEATISALRIT